MYEYAVEITFLDFQR